MLLALPLAGIIFILLYIESANIFIAFASLPLAYLSVHFMVYIGTYTVSRVMIIYTNMPMIVALLKRIVAWFVILAILGALVRVIIATRPDVPTMVLCLMLIFLVIALYLKMTGSQTHRK